MTTFNHVWVETKRGRRMAVADKEIYGVDQPYIGMALRQWREDLEDAADTEPYYAVAWFLEHHGDDVIEAVREEIDDADDDEIHEVGVAVEEETAAQTNHPTHEEWRSRGSEDDSGRSNNTLTL